MKKEQISVYLDKHNLMSKVSLANHILELKRNTNPDVAFISKLVYLLENSKDVSFTSLMSQTMNKIKNCPKGGLQCFCDGSCNEKKSLDNIIGNLEGINRPVSNEFHSDPTPEQTLKAFKKLLGKKESQEVKKAPIFTYCKVNKNAIEALSLRALYGHEKYEEGNDWENFSRVPNGDFEYSNAEFRHALNIGEEDEELHLISAAWNAVARLEIHLRSKVK